MSVAVRVQLCQAKAVAAWLHVFGLHGVAVAVADCEVRSRTCCCARTMDETVDESWDPNTTRTHLPPELDLGSGSSEAKCHRAADCDADATTMLTGAPVHSVLHRKNREGDAMTKREPGRIEGGWSRLPGMRRGLDTRQRGGGFRTSGWMQEG